MSNLRQLASLLCLMSVLPVMVLATETPLKKTQSAEQGPSRVPQTGWFYGAFLNLNASPYIGVSPDTVALPAIGYKGTRFSLIGPSASYLFYKGEEIKATALITYKSLGFEANDSRQLSGMTKRQNSLFGGFSISLKQESISYSVKYLHDLQDHSGEQDIQFNTSYHYNYGPFFFTPTLSLNYWDSAYSNYYFGVADHESKADRKSFTPNASLNPSTSINFATPIFFKGFTRASVTHSWLDSSLRNSPIVKNKSMWKMNLSFTRFF